MQSDPIGLKAGPNTYTYVGSNPTRYTDRRGLVPNPAEGACALGPNPACLGGVVADIVTWIVAPAVVAGGAATIASNANAPDNPATPVPPQSPAVPTTPTAPQQCKDPECERYDARYDPNTGPVEFDPESGAVSLWGTIYCFYRCPNGDHKVIPHSVPAGFNPVSVLNWCPKTILQ